MIFNLTSQFISSIKPSLLSDLVAEIVQHEHYLVVPTDTIDYLWDVVDNNSSTTQVELWLLFQGFSPSVQIQTYLTTVCDTSYSYDELYCLASKPAIVLLENNREWDVYRSMMKEYRSDPVFANLFQLLEGAASDRLASRLIPKQAGGFSEVPNCLNSIKNAEGYNGIVKQKVFVVMDRDTNSYIYPLPQDKKPAITLLSGKEFSTVNESDIYSLTQPNFIWHMWYRRSIENYFPDSVFSLIGRTRRTGMPPFENNYYAKVEDYFADGRIVKKKDLKNDLGRLASHMTRTLYDLNLHSFSIGGNIVNEIQLFLLKMVRVI